MAFCVKCGAQIAPEAGFCPACGAPVGGAQQPYQQGYQQPYQQPSYSGGSDAANNKAMGILAYIGILVLVPIFAAKDSPFARYHANQGLVLAITEIAYGILIGILNAVFFAISVRLGAILSPIFGLGYLVFLVFMILGIVNAANGQMKPLPVIGGITILK